MDLHGEHDLEISENIMSEKVVDVDVDNANVLPGKFSTDSDDDKPPNSISGCDLSKLDKKSPTEPPNGTFFSCI